MAPRADPALMEDGGASADDASIGAVLNTLAKVNRKPGSLARPLSIPNAKMPTDIGDEALVTDTGYLWLRLSKQGDGSWRRCGAALPSPEPIRQAPARAASRTPPQRQRRTGTPTGKVRVTGSPESSRPAPRRLLVRARKAREERPDPGGWRKAGSRHDRGL